MESKRLLTKIEYANRVVLFGVLSGNVDLEMKDCYFRIK